MKNLKNKIQSNYEETPVRRPRRYETEYPRKSGLEVFVKDGDVMKAWRKLKKKIKESKLMEEIKERQYYKKPSTIRQEKIKERRRVLQKLNREQEDFRTMGVKRRR